MTIEQIVDLPVDELEKLTEADVMKMAKDQGWLNITRPELAPKPEKSSTRSMVDFERNAKVGKIKDFAAKWGFGDDLFD